MLNKILLALILVAAWVTAESGEDTGARFGALVFGPVLSATSAPGPGSGPGS